MYTKAAHNSENDYRYKTNQSSIYISTDKGKSIAKYRRGKRETIKNVLNDT